MQSERPSATRGQKIIAVLWLVFLAILTIGPIVWLIYRTFFVR